MNVVLYKSAIARINVYDFTTKLDKRMTVRRILCIYRCIRLHSAAILCSWFPLTTNERTVRTSILHFESNPDPQNTDWGVCYLVCRPISELEIQYNQTIWSFWEVLWHFIETKKTFLPNWQLFFYFDQTWSFFVLLIMKQQFAKFKNIYCRRKRGLSDFNKIMSGLIIRDDLMPTLFDY